jgi:hypothetical protein
VSKPKTPVEIRFPRHVVTDISGCHLWTAYTMKNGYATFWDGESKKLVHRIAYTLYVGLIPEGMTIDHTCRVRHCVNPEHLEAVTQRENNARGDSWAAISNRIGKCIAGHDFDAANTRTIKGKRHCRKCDARRQREYRERRDAA